MVRVHVYDNCVKLWCADDMLHPITLPPDTKVETPDT